MGSRPARCSRKTQDKFAIASMAKFVPLLKRDQNKDFHGRLMQNRDRSVTTLLVQGSRNTYHPVLFYKSSVTVLCKKMNLKTGLKLKE